jgi:hypothetical protein
MIEVSYRKDMGKFGKDKVQGDSFEVTEDRVLRVMKGTQLIAVYDSGEWAKAALVADKSATEASE